MEKPIEQLVENLQDRIRQIDSKIEELYEEIDETLYNEEIYR